MSLLLAILKPEIRAFFSNVQMLPQKRNELLSLVTRLKNNFHKTQADSSRGNRNVFFFKKTEEKNSNSHPKRKRRRDNNREKTTGIHPEMGEYQMPFHPS